MMCSAYDEAISAAIWNLWQEFTEEKEIYGSGWALQVSWNLIFQCKRPAFGVQLWEEMDVNSLYDLGGTTMDWRICRI
jgi:hypothetical protein